MEHLNASHLIGALSLGTGILQSFDKLIVIDFLQRDSLHSVDVNYPGVIDMSKAT